MVLFAHAPDWADGNLSRELLARILHSQYTTQYTLGSLGVDGFFLLSGFLIVGSWRSDPEFLNYLRKRVLRIVPGYLVAMLISTIAVGILAPGISHFFRHLNRHYWESLLILDGPITPPVFPGGHVTGVNMPVWTIPYEFRCYLVVAFWGILGLFRRPVLWVVATAVLLFLVVFPALTGPAESWHALYYLTGQPPQIARLGAAFFVGGSFSLFRGRIPFRPWFAAISVAVVIAVGAFASAQFEPAVLVFGGYLLFFLGQAKGVRLDWMKHVPDISYGVYLYGGPVEALWIWYHAGGSPWMTALASVLICYPLGWLSWHMVERPMLQLKRRASAALPPP